ncbi:trehalose-phosphatase [Cellulomonas massiliensis]|uniref:trehalose-phosphatase n=1 Tax=Cellulomonas massiliensis TaxID=1465811 RepID=UPI000311BD85|nr:trehalose-phosphatase [Cellulomonas massiliensis]
MPELPADLVDALRSLARRGRPLVALDFDGTLAPLQDDPAASRMVPAARAALERLAALDGDDAPVLALVSGRSVVELHELSAMPPGSSLVGSHGAERAHVREHGLEHDAVRLDDEQRARLADLGAAAQALADGRDGVWVESKPTAVVVHTRRAGPQVAGPAEQEALRLGDRLGSTVLHGKDVVEISVLETSKGRAVAALRDEVGARGVLYAGDDVTDEHAFEVLGDDDVTVKVGPGETVARFRVDDAEAVAAALDVLADASA